MSIDVDKIIEELATLPEYKGQISLQGTVTSTDPFAGVGRVEKMEFPEEDFTIPLFNIPFINSLIEKFKMYRTRVMTLDPRRCYSYHQDSSYRIHIPVVSNPKTWLMIDEQLYKLRVGEAYIVNTKMIHTAINCYSEPRTHIVGCISEEDAIKHGFDEFQLVVRPVQELR